MVSPANGSLSMRIGIPVPPGRGFTLPLSINYDSAGVDSFSNYQGGGYWISGDNILLRGGWSYNIPILTSTPYTYALTGTPPYGSPVTCQGQNNYAFTDPSGGRHAFVDMTSFPSPGPTGCADVEDTGGGDDWYGAGADDNGNVTVSDLDGTVYTFLLSQVQKSYSSGGSGPETFFYLPSQIEDRNGNLITVTQSGTGSQTSATFTDSTGRAAISFNGFGQNSSVAVSGFPSPFQVDWGAASSSFPTALASQSGICVGPVKSESDSHPEITSIALPNGQSYQFQYDPTYGLLQKITYPNGAYSRYVWGINGDSEVQGGTVNPGTSIQANCYYFVGVPAVMHHYVSYDGINETLEEDYSYSTTWNGVSWTEVSAILCKRLRRF